MALRDLSALSCSTLRCRVTWRPRSQRVYRGTKLAAFNLLQYVVTVKASLTSDWHSDWKARRSSSPPDCVHLVSDHRSFANRSGCGPIGLISAVRQTFCHFANQRLSLMLTTPVSSSPLTSQNRESSSPRLISLPSQGSPSSSMSS